MFQRFWVLLRRRTNEQGKSKQKKLAGCPEGSQRHGFQDAVSAAENLLSLYNAVNRTSYTDADALTVVTLENAIYMNMKNDTAFILDDRLSLYEHQSTWNPNMPLRNLFYVSRTYQAFVKDESVYSDRKIQIPTPHFIVFYNGMERIPERVVLKLSDSFEKKDGEPELELIVTVLNINQGNNKEIMELCQVLKEYMLYVEKMRRYAKVMGLNEAAEKTVSECIREGILEDFLRQNREEAVAMSIFEYDEERELKLLRKAQFEYGRESLLKSKIITKLKKGKSLEQIAEDLEEELPAIEKLVRRMKNDGEYPA